MNPAEALFLYLPIPYWAAFLLLLYRHAPISPYVAMNALSRSLSAALTMASTSGSVTKSGARLSDSFTLFLSHLTSSG